jgi:predicted Na+-dependent transporter
MIKSKKDLYAGLMFIIIGSFFALWALNYPMGTAVRMGPAYFPTILGWLTAALGVIILIRGFTIPDEDPRPTQLKPLLLINGAAVLFGLLIDPLKIGFVGAVVASVIVCASGGYEFKWKEAVIESVVLVVVCYLAFVYGLGLPFRLFPWS